MNDLGLLLIGGTVRVTVLAVVGLTLALALRRRGPAAGVLAAMTTLTGLVAVTALSLSPWPRFWSIDLVAGSPSARTAGQAAETKPDTGRGPSAALLDPPPTPARDTQLTDFARGFVQEFRSQEARTVRQAGGHWRWPAWVAAALLAASALGFARLAMAVRAVATLRRRSRPILDARLREEVGRLQAETGCPRPVETRETDDLATPATVGWLRPVLLLPSDWCDWDAPERRAVLAHELGHVRRGDYAWGLWAQACLAVHAYHPLAHWLVARLRLEQELAADAWGARLSGGNRPYLEALARLALRRPGPLESSAEPWPARPFLPTRGTLLRRIEMLRDAAPNSPRTDPVSPMVRASTVAALAAAGLLVAGLRGPATIALAQQAEARPQAADPKADRADVVSDIFDLSHAPVNTMLALAGRPAEVLTRPEFRPVAELFNQAQRNRPGGSLNLNVDEVEGVVLLFFRGREGGGQPGPSMPPTIITRTTRPQDWNAVAGTFVGNPTVVEFEGQSYIRSKTPPSGAGYFTPDDRTIVIGTEDALQQMIVARKGGPVRHAWDGAWSRVTKGQLTLAFDPIWVLAQIPPAQPNTPQAALAGPAGMFAPLLNQTTGYAVGLDLNNKLGFDLVATCSSEEGSRRVNETMQAMITLTRNALPGLKQQVGVDQGPQREAVLRIFGLVEPLLANARAEVDEGQKTVRLSSHSEGDIAFVVQTILPAMTAARGAAVRSQSFNNIKQLGLAMHNYESVNGHFPPAIVRPADGKPPYSWRVAILPFIEQGDVFKEYNFNEPWDSPANRKLIERMPAIYRHPADTTKSGNTAYFVVTGEPTLFPPGNPGLKIQDVIDGTSNTIMVVEAKRDVPWTKPEDIPYDPANPMPEFGGFTEGGFSSGFADGSAHFISTGIDPQVLKAILSRAGGEVVSPEALNPDRPGFNRTIRVPRNR